MMDIEVSAFVLLRWPRKDIHMIHGSYVDYSIDIRTEILQRKFENLTDDQRNSLKINVKYLDEWISLMLYFSDMTSEIRKNHRKSEATRDEVDIKKILRLIHERILAHSKSNIKIPRNFKLVASSPRTHPVKAVSVDTDLSALMSQMELREGANEETFMKITGALENGVSGILLYSAPGTGKSFLISQLRAWKLKTRSDTRYFVQLRGKDLFSKYFGESEKLIHKLQKYSKTLPCFNSTDRLIVVIDQIDLICSNKLDTSQSSLLSALYTLIDCENTFVVGVTHRPDILPGSLTRPGRLGKWISVDCMDKTKRINLFTNFMLEKLPSRSKQKFMENSLEKAIHDANYFENWSVSQIKTYCKKLICKFLTSRDISHTQNTFDLCEFSNWYQKQDFSQVIDKFHQNSKLRDFYNEIYRDMENSG